MGHFSRRSLLAGSISLLPVPRPEFAQEYRFATADYEIRMSLEYHDNEPNPGLGFEDRSTDRHFCLSTGGDQNRNCIDDFVGSIAVMRYRIEPRVASRSTLTLREYVRSIDQCDWLSPRPPFERIIEVRGGLASDIQVYGYRTSGDEQASADDSWCLLRQNLYLPNNAKPFLVVHWKHTLRQIRVIDVIPQRGTSTLVGGQLRRR
jgi:hypothetical protein